MTQFNVSDNAGKIINTLVDSQDLASKDGAPQTKNIAPTAVPNAGAKTLVFNNTVSGQILSTVVNPA